ncbi:hypothetical protein BDN72DRAFT_594879 [Pluteus cervinus]|uniref:Uncharacterized protein n=1 Tax=Pluteus cervinus TaxID=181527 RepID=A0ACD3AWB0_9AGAR|nr:hypothetical protein BDN72DRAFT_594879 [Pluteus cervinus]
MAVACSGFENQVDRSSACTFCASHQKNMRCIGYCKITREVLRMVDSGWDNLIRRRSVQFRGLVALFILTFTAIGSLCM